MGNEMIEVARAVRWYLPEIVGDRALAVDTRIANMLADAHGGADIDDELAKLFLEEPALHEWAALCLAHPRHLPPPLQPFTDRSYSGLPGHGEPVSMEEYRCPHHDYVWYRIYVEDSPPPCPTHGPVLRRVG